MDLGQSEDDDSWSLLHLPKTLRLWCKDEVGFAFVQTAPGNRRTMNEANHTPNPKVQHAVETYLARPYPVLNSRPCNISVEELLKFASAPDMIYGRNFHDNAGPPGRSVFPKSERATSMGLYCYNCWQPIGAHGRTTPLWFPDPKEGTTH